MNILKQLEIVEGRGTSLITMTIATNANALNNAITLLTREYSVSANIKSRI